MQHEAPASPPATPRAQRRQSSLRRFFFPRHFARSRSWHRSTTSIPASSATADVVDVSDVSASGTALVDEAGGGATASATPGNDGSARAFELSLPPSPQVARASPIAALGAPVSPRVAQLRDVVMDLTAPQSDEPTQNRAVGRLATLIDDATTDEAKQLGECVRDHGALEALLTLLERPSTEQDALRVLGNLASNAVDPNAADTKRMLFEMGAFDTILQRIYSQSGATVVYALGSVQNMCARREFALHMQATGADTRLRQLYSSSSNSSARAFAQGCLSNMEAVLSTSFVPDPRLEPRSSSSSNGEASPTSPRTPNSPRALANPVDPGPVPRSARRPSASPPRKVSPPRDGSPPGTADVDHVAKPRPLGKDGLPCCAVCLDKPVNTALTPCFHAAFCNSCAVTISFNRYPCPICRARVNGLQRIYL